MTSQGAAMNKRQGMWGVIDWILGGGAMFSKNLQENSNTQLHVNLVSFSLPLQDASINLSLGF